MSDWSADPDGFNESVIREFRASGGVVGGELAHMHLLLLTTTDLQRGRRRTTPLAYHRRGQRYVVIASNGGATTHPKWFRDLERDPNLTVEVGAERAAVFAAIVARAPAAGAFQEKAGRTIPVIELVRLVGVEQAALRTSGELEPPVESRASKVQGRSIPPHAGSRARLSERKIAVCGDFASPLTDSNRRPPPYHALRNRCRPLPAVAERPI